jgi:hypothetical protein
MAFEQGWHKALEDKETWETLDTKGKIKFFKHKVKEEIFSLPKKPLNFWQKLFNKIVGDKVFTEE